MTVSKSCTVCGTSVGPRVYGPPDATEKRMLCLDCLDRVPDQPLTRIVTLLDHNAGAIGIAFHVKGSDTVSMWFAPENAMLLGISLQARALALQEAKAGEASGFFPNSFLVLFIGSEADPVAKETIHWEDLWAFGWYESLLTFARENNRKLEDVNFKLIFGGPPNG